MTAPGEPREHDAFEFDDAAYVLGALDEPERHAFEQHLLTCRRCQGSIAELDGLAAALARVQPDALESEQPPETLLPRLQAAVTASRRRRSVRTAALGFAAACLLAVLLVAGGRWYSSTHSARALALRPVGPNPAGAFATIRLTGSQAAPRIELDCGYRAVLPQPYPAGTAPSYRMVVINRAGAARDLGSWTPQPGEDVQLSRQSPWPRSALAEIQIADLRGTVLLQLRL
jgi:anti-sigma factor RsiW